MNLVLTLLVLGGGAAAVWSGITDPDGGTFAGLARAVRGESQVKATAAPSGFLANVASYVSGTGSSGGGAAPAGYNPDPPAAKDTGAYNLGAVKPWVKAAAYEAGPMFGIKTIGGYRTSARDPNGHPAGRALDFMTETTGSALSGYLLANRKRLGVEYVIWQQRINSGDGRGWRRMEDRGSRTQNHFDHVHANFTATDPRGRSTAV